MNKKTFTLLEYDRILDMLSEHCVSETIKEKVRGLKPMTDLVKIKNYQNETTAAKAMIEASSSVPLSTMQGIYEIMNLLGKGAMLTAHQLECISTFLNSCKRMHDYLSSMRSVAEDLAAYGGSIDGLRHVQDEITRCIKDGRVFERATPELMAITKKREALESRVKAKMESLLRGHGEWFADSYVTLRKGRKVLPVKREHKAKVKGSVVDVSGSGGTVYIEPDMVRNAQSQLDELTIAYENEVRRILYTLTAMVEDESIQLKVNFDAMGILDAIFARAKLSLQMNANPATVTLDQPIVIVEGRHPLLGEDAVPLNFTMGDDGIRAVVITGPNTGGKTVALKTVGLLTMMAQTGLHVPMKEQSSLRLMHDILCDIGDGQSITQSLSTFSAHITTIIDLLKDAGEGALVLLDELGGGTDPAEGMGIAVSLLEAFYHTGCFMVATTHYPEVKTFAKKAEGFINARMAFDLETLRPLYRLDIGEAGESCALQISLRLGLPKNIVERAHEVSYGDKKLYDTPTMKKPKPNIVPKIEKNVELKAPAPAQPKRKKKVKAGSQYQVGDSVYISFMKRSGIVSAEVNERGEVEVLIKDKKIRVNHKRLKPYLKNEDIYPEDYDLDVVLKSAEQRKAEKIMSKRHQEGVEVVLVEGKASK